VSSCSTQRNTFGRALLAVGAIATLPYVRGVSNPFAAEDFEVLLVSSLDFPIFWRLASGASRIKIVTLLKDWLSYQIWGVNPVGYHIVSLLLHVCCSLLVCYLGYLLFENARAGMLGGLVFAVYPRHHSAVLWLAAGQFVLGSLFVLAGLTLFVLYLRKRQTRYYLLSSVCLVLALFTQEVGVLFLPFAFLIELLWRYRSGESVWSTLCDLDTYKKYIPLFLFLGGFVWLSFSGSRAFKLQTYEINPKTRGETYHFLGIDATRARELLGYCTYLMWPQIPLGALDINLGSFLLAGVSGCVFLLIFIKGKLTEWFSVAWVIGAILPFLFFSPFGPADRYFYLAGAGFALLLGQLGARAYRRWQGKWGRILGVGILSLYVASSTVLLQARIAEWRQAGEMAQGIIEQVVELQPQIPPRSRMFFVGLPEWNGQAYVLLGGGIRGAMRDRYGDLRLEVYRSFDPQLATWLLSRQEGTPTPGEYVFLYRDGKIHDVSAFVDDFEAFYESWWWYK